MGLDIDLYTPKIDIGDDGADDIIIEITGLKSINKFIGLEDTPLYYDNGKFFKVEDNKIVYTDIQWKDISGDLEDAPDIIDLIKELVKKINKEVIYEYIDQHNNSQFAHPYIQNIIEQNYDTLDTKINDTKEELTEALNTEITNRETADNELSESIQQETLVRIEADTTLQNNINTLTNNLNIEIENRTNADNLLRDDIDNISGELAQEIIDRQTQDNLLQEQITSNYNTLDDKIDTEISNRTSADTTLQNNINAEALTRQNADTTLQGNIDKLTQTVEDNNTAVNNRIDETNDAVSILSDTVTSNYNTLNGKIDTEISNRTLADTTLQNNIDAEALTRQNADTTLQGNIDKLTQTVSDNYTDLDGKISDLTTTVNDNDTAINSKVDGINTTLTTSINNLSNTVSNNYTTLDAKIDNTKTSLEGNISDLSNTVNQNYTDLSNAITTSASTINSRIDSEVSTLNTAIGTETTNRQNADNNLQSQIDAIVSSSDVFDIVGTYAELQAYDISTVPVNDIVKVLVDSSHDNSATYYRCVETSGVKSWSYIGSEGAYYTKSESGTKFVAKTTTINNKPLSSNITLTASDVNALPDTTVIGNGILTLQKNGVNIDTFNANATANKNINITVPTDTADLTNGAGFITSASLPTVNNGTLDIQVNGTSVGTFTANQAGNTTANIVVPDSATWGNITGTLSNQTDLQTALDAKQNTISDLSTIRSGASLGATALQPNDNITELVNNAGYITGITSSDVTTALGYIPYNSTNPNGYITTSALTGYATETYVDTGLATKQTTLVSGTNIKTINNQSLLGSGNITIQGGGGGGAVDSVNGQTGTVVLTASDVGALADTTTIPSKTSDLKNDSGFITVSALNGYATENWVNNQGFLTSVPTATTSNLGLVKPDGTTITIDSNGVLSGSVSVDVDQVYDGASANAQSGIAIAGELNKYQRTLIANDFLAKGVEWTNPVIISAFQDNTWYSIAFDGAKYLMVGYNRYTTTSTDGITWTTPTQNLPSYQNRTWKNVLYDGTKFIAVSSYGDTTTSTDGTTWTTPVQTPYSNSDCKGISYDGNSTYVMLYSNSRVSTSSNGANWGTAQQVLSTTYSWYHIFHNGTTFVALGSDGISSIVYSTSTDGVTWATPVVTGLKGIFDDYRGTSVAYNGQEYILYFCSRDDVLYYESLSNDGLNWGNQTLDGTTKSGNYSSKTLLGAIGDKFIAFNQNAQVQYSTGNYKLYTTYSAGTGISIDNGVITNTHMTTDWGELSGYIDRQKDLNIKLDAKQNVLIAGNNITLSDTTVSDWTDSFYIDNFIEVADYDEWNGLAWNDAQGFVAITYNGYVSTSRNGTTWSIPEQNSTLGSNYKYQCMTSFWDRTGMIPPWEWYIVVLGYSGRIVALNAKSNEWTVVGDLGSNAWQRITFNSDDMTLLAIGNTGYVSKSENSINNWSTPTQLLDSSISWGSLAYGNNTYVALGRKNSHFWSSTSSDGDTWSTPTQLNIHYNINGHNALAYDDTQFVALSYDGYISTSTDGITWSTSVQNQKLGSESWRNLVYTDEFNSVQAVAMGLYKYEALLSRNTVTEISATGMPSDKYINLTLGASGATYTAPANGWFIFSKRGTAPGQWMVADCGAQRQCYTSSTNQAEATIYMAVKKGDVLKLTYNLGGENVFSRFIYAQGSESEASQDSGGGVA